MAFPHHASNYKSLTTASLNREMPFGIGSYHCAGDVLHLYGK